VAVSSLWLSIHARGRLEEAHKELAELREYEGEAERESCFHHASTKCSRGRGGLDLVALSGVRVNDTRSAEIP
jgi:hypothetical protein